MNKIISVPLVLLFPVIASAASLSLSPTSQSVTTGDTFDIAVVLNTGVSSIDGVDIRYLNYNPSLLQVVKVTPGSLMPLTLSNSSNASLGRITFSQVAAGGTKYSGSGTLATVTFKALASGTASVTFNYTSGNTTDSNVAAAGSDVLSSVINGSYTVNGASVSPSPSGGGSGGGGSTTSGVTTYYTDTPAKVVAVNNAASGTSMGATGCIPGLTTGQITSVVGLGSTGSNVTNLQKFLVSKGYLTSDSVTGYFGLLTQSALQKFQTAQGIVTSGSPLTTGYGNAGPSTRAKINAIITSSSAISSNCSAVVPSVSGGSLTRNLSRGSGGADVTVLQQFLVNQGYITADSVTGYFGPLTEAALQKFQSSQGIVSSGTPAMTGYGNCGPSTRAKINALLH